MRHITTNNLHTQRLFRHDCDEQNIQRKNKIYRFLATAHCIYYVFIIFIVYISAFVCRKMYMVNEYAHRFDDINVY